MTVFLCVEDLVSVLYSIMKNNFIGVFDSGVGGLSVWKELITVLPNESIIYYADSGNCPYGVKTQEEIIQLSKRIVEFLLTHNVKLIVVACNTATASAIDYLRQNYDISFVGMEPAVKPAALKTKKRIVGVLATEGTFNGRLFNETTNKWASEIKVEVQVGKGFVELVEQSDLDSDNAKKIVKKAVQPLLDKGIDQLVLACTHYPFLCERIKEISNNLQLEIINPAPAVANQVKNVLERLGILNRNNQFPKYKFYSSGTLVSMRKLLEIIKPDLIADFEIKELKY